MQVLLCPDKFRGSATASEVSAALAEGIARAAPDVTVVKRPVADGGEGTVDALVAAGWQRRTSTVTGPLGEARRADIAVRGDHAVVEMAQASGIALVRPPPRPMDASSVGTGELIRFALDLGCTSITLAVGGSATTDGGAGALQALGAHLLDADGRELRPGGGYLREVHRLDLSGLDRRLGAAHLTVATDVDNPLLGPHGAAEVFGAQKGANAAERARLAAGLERLAACVVAATGAEHRNAPGAGAAGGLGFAAIAVFGATRVSGAGFVIDALGVPELLRSADLAVVGEGRLDEQSLRGKAPIAVARLGKECGVPVVAVCGAVELPVDQLADAGICDTYSLIARAGSFAAATRGTHDLLVDVGLDIGAAVRAKATPPSRENGGAPCA
jgi:glycerate kinase